MASYQFVKRSPDKGYFGRQLWLPKKHINTRSVKAGLEFPVMDDKGISYVQLWCEDRDHLIVPREFITRQHYGDLPFPVVSVQPLSYPKVEFRSKVTLDFKEPKKTTQRDAFADMEKAHCGILNLACGAGKTNLALHYIASKKVPALVIVNNTTLIDQWQNRIQEFLDVPGGVGVIQGPPDTWDWEGRGICVAMIHSLALRHAEIPPGMDRYFGLVFFDECFVAGTLVDGIPIERRRVGDRIISFNEVTGEFEEQEIERVFKRRPRILISVHIGDEEIICTPTHPFWTNRGWVPAMQLHCGEMVLYANHEQEHMQLRGSISSWARVDRIEVHEQTSDGTFGGRCPDGFVYNLQVSKTHTYTVGERGVVVHNCHHLSAPLFSQTAPLFFGERHGLTATNSREDGLEVIYQYHVGEAYHSNLMQDLKPRIYFQQCPIAIDTRDPAVKREIYDKAGRLNIPKLRNYLGGLPEVNDFIAEKLHIPLATGRKILVLSHSVDQLRKLNEMFDDSGLCTGREKPEKRLETLRTKQLSFGTLQLVREALDESTLDTLYFITPFGSQEIKDGGLNTLQQGMGRIQRFRKGKKTPVVVVLDHVYIPKMHRMCSKMKRLLNDWPEEQGGALEYTTLRPYSKEATNG